MKPILDARTLTRRQLLQAGGILAGSGFIAQLVPSGLAATLARVPGQATSTADLVAAARAQTAKAPIDALELTDRLTMLSGPGGNVVVLNGPDGKIVVDGFVQPAFSQLKKTLDAMGAVPITWMIDTHWHFDHADNNGSFRQAGAGILAHQNTRKRLTETHELLGMRFVPVPTNALPTVTFTDFHKLQANAEEIGLGYVPPAHTDTDIYVHYMTSNVLHVGDLFFNGSYPFIDAGTGGSITGMIAGSDRMIATADANTKIVPGHGPLGNREALTKYREMLVTVRDRVHTLKSSGRTFEETIAAKPTADLDPVWGRGFMQPNDFVALVYHTP